MNLIELEYELERARQLQRGAESQAEHWLSVKEQALAQRDAARAEAKAFRDALVETHEALNCGVPDEDGWCPGHSCERCDDYVDRNAVIRLRNMKLFAAHPKPAGGGG